MQNLGMVWHKCTEEKRHALKEYRQQPYENNQENGNKQGSTSLPSRLVSPTSSKTQPYTPGNRSGKIKKEKRPDI